MNKISFESLQNSLNDCMSDLRRLKEMGLIRSFESEEEIVENKQNVMNEVNESIGGADTVQFL